MPERRTDKRVQAQLKVWCEGEAFTLLAETLNVSKRGMFIRTSSPPPPDARFQITVEQLGMMAEVELRWARTPGQPGRTGLGLEIVEFIKGGAAFERFVDRNSSKSGEHKVTWPPGSEPDPE